MLSLVACGNGGKTDKVSVNIENNNIFQEINSKKFEGNQNEP